MTSHRRIAVLLGHGGRRDERGQATTILLVAMVIAILAITMMLLRIGHANDLRTQARQAADAAALASASSARDQAAAMIYRDHVAPMFVPITGDGETSARSYAQQNGSVVTKYQAAGTSALVSVRTRECIPTEKGGGQYSVEKPCVRTDNDKEQKSKQGDRTATATSAAVVDMPTCFNEPVYSDTTPREILGYRIMCTPPGDTEQYNASLMTLGDIVDKLFKVHLTNSFNPNLGNPFAASSVGNLPPASSPERHANEEMGRKLAADLKGWEGEEWQCLDQLWLHESGWDHHADNPTSDAYGIPQSLPGSKMASAGADWQTNPATQIKWGLNYISERYGTPCNAWSQWQARNPHWY